MENIVGYICSTPWGTVSRTTPSLGWTPVLPAIPDGWQDAGTGAAPILADLSKEMDILTVAVVTKPFGFEGRRRMQQAEAGIAELKDKVDSLVIIPNERLKHATDQKITFANAFEIADDVLRQAVQSISDLIRDTGFINLDFADVTAIMKNAGMAHMGVGRAAGKGKAEEAARMAAPAEDAFEKEDGHAED